MRVCLGVLSVCVFVSAFVPAFVLFLCVCLCVSPALSLSLSLSLSVCLRVCLPVSVSACVRVFLCRPASASMCMVPGSSKVCARWPSFEDCFVFPFMRLMKSTRAPRLAHVNTKPADFHLNIQLANKTRKGKATQASTFSLWEQKNPCETALPFSWGSLARTRTRPKPGLQCLDVLLTAVPELLLDRRSRAAEIEGRNGAALGVISSKPPIAGAPGKIIQRTSPIVLFTLKPTGEVNKWK